MADRDKVDIKVVADLKDPAKGIDFITQSADQLISKLEKLQQVLTKIEQAKPGKQFAALFGASNQVLQQNNAPSGRSGIDNTFIQQLVRQQQQDMKSNVDVIQASMKKFSDSISKLLADTTDEARAAAKTLADVRRIRQIRQVGGRSADDIIAQEERDAAERASRRERRQRLIEERERKRIERETDPVNVTNAQVTRRRLENRIGGRTADEIIADDQTAAALKSTRTLIQQLNSRARMQERIERETDPINVASSQLRRRRLENRIGGKSVDEIIAEEQTAAALKSTRTLIQQLNTRARMQERVERENDPVNLTNAQLRRRRLENRIGGKTVDEIVAEEQSEASMKATRSLVQRLAQQNRMREKVMEENDPLNLTRSQLNRLRLQRRLGGRTAEDISAEEEAKEAIASTRSLVRRLNNQNRLRERVERENDPLTTTSSEVRRGRLERRIGGRTSEEILADEDTKEALRTTRSLVRQLNNQNRLRERVERENDPDTIAMRDYRALMRRYQIGGRTGQELADERIAAQERRRSGVLTSEEANAAVSRRFQLSAAARGYQGGVPLLEERFRTFADYASIGLAVSSVAALLKGVVDLDKELRQFQAITATSNIEMRSFEKSLLDLAATSKFSATELAQVSTQLGQAGLTAKQVGPALDAVQKLAAASGSTLKEATDLVTSAIGVFNVQGSEVSSIANTFTSALNLTKLTMDKLSLGFQYGANIARDLGLSYTELTAALGTLSNSGIRSGSTLGTGLRQLMIDLQTPTEKAKEVFARLGITLDDINVKTHGLTGVLENLRAKGFTTADAFNAFEVRAVTAFSALTAGIEQTRRLEQQMLLSSSATDALNIQMQSFANQIARLYNAISTVVYRAFKPMMDAMTGVVSVLADMFGAIAKLDTLLGIGGTVFGTVAMALLIGRFVNFAGVIIGLARSFNILGSSAAGAAASVATANAAAGAGAAALGGRALVGAALGGPIGIGITAAAVGIGAVSYLGSRRANQADEAQANLSDAQGKYDATYQSITRLREEMQRLIDRQVELDKSDDARKTRILELRKAFGELGLAISDNAKNTAELIDALQKLDKELTARAAGQNLLRIDARRAKINTLESQFNDTFGENQRNTYRRLPASVRRMLGDDGVAAWEAATGARRAAEGQSANDFYGRQLAVVMRLMEQNPNDTFLPGLRDGLRNLLQRGSNVQAEKIALDSDLQQRTRLNYEGLANRTGLTDRVTDAVAEFNRRRVGVEQERDPIKRLQMSKDLEEEARQRFLPLLEAREALVNEMRRTASPEEDRRIQEMAKNNEVAEAFARARSSIVNVGESGKKLAQELQVLLLNQQIERLNAEISQSNSRARATNNQQTILNMGMKVQELIQSRINAELEKLKVERDNASTPRETYEALQREIREKGEAELNRAATQNAETLREVQMNLLRQTNAVADRQLNMIATQIRVLQDRMKDPNATADQMRKLSEEFNKLVEQREAIIRGQNERARVMNPERGGFVMNPGVSGAAANIAAQLGEYGVRIGSLETAGTFNPNARNDRSGAYGLFQFLPSTLMGKPGDGMGGLAANNAELRKLLTDAGITNSAQLNEALRDGKITIPVELQIKLMQQFTEQNRRILGDLANNPENLALAHFLGAGGAKQLLDAIARDPNAQALGNGITAEGLTKNNLPQDASATRVRDFYLNLYRNRDVSGVGRTEQELSEQGRDDRVQQNRLNTIRESIQNSEIQLQNARKEADQRLAAARNAVRAAQEGMALGNASEGDVQKAQQQVRVAQLNQYTVELNANLKEQQRIQAEINKLTGEDANTQQQRQTYQNYLNQLLGKEKELRNEINIAGRANVRTPIDSGNLTQVYLQRQGYLTTDGRINDKGMIEKGYLDTLAALDKGFQNFFMTIAQGELSFKTLGNAAKAFGLSIIQTMMSIISKRLGEMLINSLFGAAGGGGNFLVSLFSTMFGGGGGGVGAPMTLSPFSLMANGGMRRAANGIGVPNRDSVPTLLMPGEAVLRNSAVSVLGEDTVTALNNQGNRKVSTPFNNDQNLSDEKQNIVNVWLVEREAIPPLGEKDIVHIIGGDLEKKGATYQLIKQINMGAK